MNSPLYSHLPRLRSLSSGPSPVASRQSKEGRFHSLRSAALWASLHGLALAITLCSGSLALAQGVTIPHEFTNGEVADATQVNDNFSALADALGVTAPNSFANSGIIGMNEVNANFQSLKLAVDTFTTDFAAATAATETAAENTCNQVGGTWDAGTSTCTPAYNCFLGGFCSRIAEHFPPSEWAFDDGIKNNVYVGHTVTSEPALGAGCYSLGEPPCAGCATPLSAWDRGVQAARYPNFHLNPGPGVPWSVREPDWAADLCASN